MGETVKTNEDPRIVELRAAAHCERDGRITRRMLAVHHVLTGGDPHECGRLFAVSRTRTYEWRARWEAEGLAGLADRPRPGQPKHLKTEREAEFLARVHAGPPRDSGLAAWRGEDLREVLAREFDAKYSLSGVYDLLHRLRQSKLVPRPQHPQSDESAQAAFKKSARPAAR